MASFDTFNQAYIAGFGDHRPARSTIGVAALPIGAAVEIEAWAHKPA
jgi:2-iminobutanoate/2-iminopropanoate deaminase